MFDGVGDDEVFKKFSEIGADVNAYTSNNITNYYFSTINNFEKSLEYLCDMIYNLNLTNERVEKEKPIIEQELRMYDDDQYNRVHRNLLSVMYNYHPVRFDIGGDVNTIKFIEKAIWKIVIIPFTQIIICFWFWLVMLKLKSVKLC